MKKGWLSEESTKNFLLIEVDRLHSQKIPREGINILSILKTVKKGWKSIHQLIFYSGTSFREYDAEQIFLSPDNR